MNVSHSETSRLLSLLRSNTRFPEIFDSLRSSPRARHMRMRVFFVSFIKTVIGECLKRFVNDCYRYTNQAQKCKIVGCSVMILRMFRDSFADVP